MNGPTIFRKYGRARFARVPHATLDDPKLSWKAKGILAYLLGKPDDWKVWINDIQNRGRDRESAVSTALMELRRNGYAQLQRRIDGRGRTRGFRLLISDAPTFPKTSKQVIVRQPEGGFQEMGQSQMGGRVRTENDTTEIDEKKERHPERESAFNSFWEEYPVKSRELECRRLFRRKKLHLISDKIIAAVRAQRRRLWVTIDPRFIPSPISWLAGERWNDQIPEPRRRGPNI